MGIRGAATTGPEQRALLAQLTEELTTAAPLLTEMITGTGETLDDITKSFMEIFATPAAEMFKREVLPGIREGFNLPGSFFGSRRFLGEQRATEEFLSGRVTPLLFQAQEAFRGRDIQRAGIASGTLGIGSGLSTAQTIQNFMRQVTPWQQENMWTQQAVSGYMGSGASVVGMFA